MRLLEARGIGRIVVVRPYPLRPSPVSHCHLRVEVGCMLKGTSSFIVIKGEDQPQPLIEKLLRLRIFGRNRMMQIAQPRHERDRTSHRLHGMFLSKTGGAQSQNQQKGKASHTPSS